jgi:hypothetical protein
LSVGSDQEHVANKAAARVNRAREALKEMQQNFEAMCVKFEEEERLRKRAFNGKWEVGVKEEVEVGKATEVKGGVDV